MQISILILGLTTFFTIQAMDVPQGTILLKDKDNNIAGAIDYHTFEDIQKLSKALQDPAHPIIFKKDLKGYTISLPLTSEQILFLIELHEKKLKTLPILTPVDIQALQLTVIILETVDNDLILVDKQIVTTFFKTIKDFKEEFGETFIIPIPQVKKYEIAFLYHAVKDLSPQDPSNYKLWVNEVENLKRKISPVKEDYIFNILKAANWLQADLRLLTALYELYTEKVPENVWEKEAEKSQLFKQINILIDNKYPSVESLLSTGKEKFFDMNFDLGASDAFVQSDKVYRLRGLSKIPFMEKCTQLTIKGTNIVCIKKDDFKGMPQLKIVNLIDNKDLYKLEKECFKPLENLYYLSIKGNDIKELIPDVFVLPNLGFLILNNNNLNTIKANWAAQLKNLSQLYIWEPNLTKVDQYWMMGLTNLQELQLSKAISPALEIQIKDDIKSYVYNRTVKVKRSTIH